MQINLNRHPRLAIDADRTLWRASSTNSETIRELDLTTCLNGFTRNGAYAAGIDECTGSLTVGRNADVVLLAVDPFIVGHTEVSSIEVDMTIFRGEVVYRR